MSVDSWEKVGVGAEAPPLTATPKREPTIVEIPLDVWRKSVANSQYGSDSYHRVGSSSSFSAAPIIVECPYDKNHRVDSTKMNGHLERCRTNFRNKMMDRHSYDNVELTCKYNILHQVLPPELQYHEERCEDRHRIPFYSLYFNPYFEDDEGQLLQYNLETCEAIDPVELRKMREGLYLNKFIGSNSPLLRPIPLECFANGGTKKSRKLLKKLEETEAMAIRAKSIAETKNRARWNPDEKSLSSAFQNPGEEESQVEDSEEGAVGGSVAAEPTDSDEEYWSKCNAPAYDFMKNSYNPRGPLLMRYPPGLTKARRRQFDKWVHEWILLILAYHMKEQQEKEKLRERQEAAAASARRRPPSRSTRAEDTELDYSSTLLDDTDIGGESDTQTFSSSSRRTTSGSSSTNPTSAQSYEAAVRRARVGYKSEATTTTETEGE